jgi:hypothetical protein
MVDDVHDRASTFGSDETVAAPPAVDAVVPAVSGRTRAVVRAVWFVTALATLALTISVVPVRHEKVRAGDPDIRAPEFRDLIDAGIDPGVAAVADVAEGLLVFTISFLVGVLIFVRGSLAPQATLLSLCLISWGPVASGLASAHRAAGPPFDQSLLGILATTQYFLASSITWSAVFWLPDGRFVPRWTAALTATFVVALAGLYFLVAFPRSHALVNLVGLPVMVIGVWAQSYRYRHVDDVVRRQQIKWAVVGIVTGALGFLVWQCTFLVLGNRTELMPRIVMAAARLFFNICQIAIPVCFTIAILRYRLWRLDLLINRSIVYGTLTGLLILVFVGGGLLLQAVFGEAYATLTYAGSTVVAALLLAPARRQLQRVVDRHLYGFRFDLDELRRVEAVGVGRPGAFTGRTIGDYQLRGLLGRGGMGEVYLGERHGRRAAIKILPEDLARDAAFRARFERESETLAAFNHPNIVKVQEAGERHGLYYMVLDYIEGRELSEVLKERGRIPLDEVRPFLQGFAAALDYAHAHGLVHRDIKPANIMVRRREDGTSEAVLLDFGVAKLMDARTMASTTGAIGTISYMAPEQILAAKNIDHRADVYALGVTVYEMLTGELPFNGNAARVLFAHLQEPPADPRTIVPDLSPAAARSLLRALAKKPEDRFQSVGAFAAALADA